MTTKKKEFQKGIRLRSDSDALTQDGEMRNDGTELKVHADGSERSVATTDQSQTLSNKTIDSANNTITVDADEATVENLEVDNLKAGVLDTDLSAVSASHDTIPSAKATKDYVDAQIQTKDEASEISYDDTGNTKVVGADVQAALDAADTEIAANATSIGTNATNLSDHLADAVDAHDASAISYVNTTSGLTATEVQAAIDEVEGRVDTAETGLSDHLADATDAHDASAISNVPAGNLAATDVQGALNELQTDIDTRALDSDLTAHLNDATDAHDASAISNVPSGNLAATDVQGALNELQTDIDTRATSSDLTTHTSASSGVHGVTGSVVGTTDTQTLTNKTITGASIQTPSRLDVKQDTRANLDVYAATAADGQIVYATDEDKYFGIVNNELVGLGGGISSPSIYKVFNADDDKASDFTASGSGTIVEESVSQLNGDNSFKYSPSAVSETCVSPSLSIPQRAFDKITNMCELVFNASHDGFSVEVQDNASNVLASTSITTADTSARLIFNLTGSETSLKFVVKTDTYTAGMNLIFDDIVFDDEPFKKIDTISLQNYVLEQPANQHLNLGTGEIKFNLATATITDVGETLLVADNNDANRTKFIATRDCSVTVTWSAGVVNAGNFAQIYKNGTRFTVGTAIDTNSYYSNASGSIDLAKGDFISVGASTQVFNQADKSWLSIQAIAQNDNVVVDGLNYDSQVYTPTQAGLGGITSSNLYWHRDGAYLVIDGSVEIGSTNTDPAKIYFPESNMLVSSKYTNNAIFGDWGNDNPSFVPGMVFSSSGKNYIEFGSGNIGQASLGALAGTQINSSGNNTLTIRARIPIEGWSATEAHIIPIADPYENHYAATFNGGNTGTFAPDSTSSNWIDNIVRTAPGEYTVNLVAGVFNVVPAVTALCNGDDYMAAVSVSTTQILLKSKSDAGANEDSGYISIKATRQGADYREPKGYFLGEVATNRTEIKFLNQDETQTGLATLSDLQFNNLEIGKAYWLDLKGRFAIGLNRFVRMTALHNGSIIAEINKGNGATGQGIDMTGTDRQYFVATATTITVEIFHGQASTGSPADSCATIGNGTVKETCARLTEANTEREVSGVF